VVDADLGDYFGSTPHADLLKWVARRIVDRRVLHLIRMWLDCPVVDEVAPDFGTTGLVGESLLRMHRNGAEHDEDETEDRRGAERQECALSHK
jgi:hypothetical protein